MADRTITSISLKDVRKLIEDKNIGEDVLAAVDNLLGLVLALAPAVAGPAALPLWTLIEPKNELIAAAKAAVKKLSRSKPSDYLDRAARMAAANCMLTYVAFFDAFRQYWPELVGLLGLPEEEARRAFADAAAAMSGGLASREERPIIDMDVTVPHPSNLDGPRIVDRGLYSELIWGIYWGFRKLSERELTTAAKVDATLTVLTGPLLGLAESFYQAEYLGMAADFEQFFIWSVLQDQAAKGNRLQQLSDDQRIWFELVSRELNSLDLGLQDLARAIAQLPRSAFTATGQPNLQTVAEALHRTYAASLQRQVIDDQFDVDDVGPKLTFPRKIHAFVPQAYRVVRYEEKTAHLEREDAWRDAEVREDIGRFIMEYLESPYSVDTPLLILGQPGSGKSLLTEMLAGHLGYPTYTTIRVKLRDINPDTDLRTLLEQQIYADTAGRRVAWADFIDSLALTPPVVILDGYDELLQATGQVLASYLDKVRRFQQEQDVQRRPVRVVVTSRVTLIDKAQIPLGTTIVKLEEFDEQRRAAWVKVWNEHNSAYFGQNETRRFIIPANPKLIELASQPLLLLMLAIYDSAANELGERPDMDQTMLYDRLLRRFIERELSKGEAGRDFRALPEPDRLAAIDREMDRLGIAAIGMFNRQDLKITRDQLNGDLRYFHAERSDLPAERPLLQADLVLGSFFFVHESRTSLREGTHEAAEGLTAFEFLHNTFGEFLAADFILRHALAEARVICKLSGDEMLASLRHQRLATLSEDWFGCLIHAPLHERPVILAMIREWGKHRLGDRQWSRTGLLDALDTIVAAQLRTVLADVVIPDPAPEQRALSPYVPMPRRGHVAVYSLNLVLLRTYLGDDRYVLEESQLGGPAGGCRPWDSLISLWRSWFRLEDLSALATLMEAARMEDRIVIDQTWTESRWSSYSSLATAYDVAATMADRPMAALAGLHMVALDGQPPEVFKHLRNCVAADFSELNPVVDILELKAHAANGDEVPADMFPLELPASMAERAGLADVAARLAHTPGQLTRASVAESTLDDVFSLSRYEAEAAVDVRVKLDPRWLPRLMSPRDVEPEQSLSSVTWPDFLVRSAAAPVLRAAARELDRTECREGAEWVARTLYSKDLHVLDVDTASALAVFAYRGDAKTVCARSLGTIIQKCEQGEWDLLDIPTETWEGLADLFQSKDREIAARKPAFVAPLADAVADSLEETSGEGSSVARWMTPFWVAALRIGVPDQTDALLAAISESLLGQGILVVAGPDRKCLISLIGWARERDDPSLAELILSERYEFGGWLGAFLGKFRSLWTREAVDKCALENNLTHKETLDLRWAVRALQSGKGKDFRRKQPLA